MDETVLDLRDIVRIVTKNYKTILIVFLSFVVIAGIASFLIAPTYEAETTIRVKQPKGLASSLLADLPVGGSGNTKQLMSTYAEIMKSRTVVQSVIDETQQDKEKTSSYKELLGRITTQPVKDTEILKVKVQANSAEEAQQIANILVEKFIQRITYLVRSEQSTVREFIGERLAAAKQDLEKAETTLEEYKRNEKIVAPDAETKALVDRLSAITKLKADNTVVLASAQAKLASTQQNLSQETVGFIADSPLIQQYKVKLAELEVNLVGELEKYTEKHPQVIAARAAITETKVKLNTEIARVVSAEAPSGNPIHQALLQGKIQAEAEIAVANAQNEAIDRVLTDSEKELTKLPAKEQGLARVMRDAMVAQEIYVMLAKRHEEARISEVMAPTDVQIIDSAISPEKPIKPKKMLNIVIAATLGLFAGTAFVFFREYLNRSIRNAEDVQYYLDLPTLGNIPDFENDARLAPKPGRWERIRQLFNW